MEIPNESSQDSSYQELISQLEPLAKEFLANQDRLSLLLNSQEWLLFLRLLGHLESRSRRTLERSHLRPEIFKAQGALQVIREVKGFKENLRKLTENFKIALEEKDQSRRPEVVYDEELEALQRESAKYAAGLPTSGDKPSGPNTGRPSSTRSRDGGAEED